MTTIWSKSAIISQIFLKLNEMKWIVHDFWLSFTINNEQIEPNLNSVFANKYDKIRCWLRNFDYFREFLNSSISLLRIFLFNCSIWKSYLLSVFGFAQTAQHAFCHNTLYVFNTLILTRLTTYCFLLWLYLFYGRSLG
jgi:hypothetical protein